MFSFAKLKDIYGAMTKNVPATFSMGRAVKVVKRFDKHVEVTDVDGVTETFSQIVMAANADKSLAMLEKPTGVERRCLGNVKCVCHVRVTCVCHVLFHVMHHPIPCAVRT
jgi:predicted NAD/FAD-binding protein